MNPLAYNISLAAGLAANTAGTALLAGPAWAAIAFGSQTIALAVFTAIAAARAARAR